MISPARRILFRLALICTVVGVVLVAVSVIVHQASGTRIDAVGTIGAVVVYLAVALWIAYAIVRIVTTKRPENGSAPGA